MTALSALDRAFILYHTFSHNMCIDSDDGACGMYTA